MTLHVLVLAPTRRAASETFIRANMPVCRFERPPSSAMNAPCIDPLPACTVLPFCSVRP